MPAGGFLRRTRHEVCHNGAVPLRGSLIVGTEATRFGTERPQHFSLGSHVGAVVRDINQFVETGEDQAPTDGIEDIPVDLGREGNTAGPPTRFTHMVRGETEGQQGRVEHLGLFRRPLHASHGSVGIDSKGHMTAVFLAAADRDHYHVVTGL